ncbi:MAG: hypothetical protein OXI41_06870 [Chloroflexota bacterium]|nr:hypothetical protein [Chloroflexota bacterium]
MTDRERAVSSFDHFDPRPGIAGPLRLRQELQRALAVLDGVVPSDGAGVAECENGAEVERRLERTIGQLRLSRLDPEACVEARQEAVEHGLGLGDRRGAGVTQVGHEPVLERAGGAFHAPFGLR